MGIVRKLEDALRDLTPLVEQGKVARLLNDVENARRFNGLVGDIRDAVMIYQVGTGALFFCNV